MNLICACVNSLCYCDCAPIPAFCCPSEPWVLPCFCWSPWDQNLQAGHTHTHTHTHPRYSHAGKEGWAVAVATVPSHRSSLGPRKPGVPGGRLPSQAFLNGPGPSPEADDRQRSSFCGPWVPPGSGPGPEDLVGPRAGPLKLLRRRRTNRK